MRKDSCPFKILATFALVYSWSFPVFAGVAGQSPLYIRVSLKEVLPAAPTMLGVSSYSPAHVCHFQGIAANDGKLDKVEWGWHRRLPWGDVGSPLMFTPGMSSGWLSADGLLDAGGPKIYTWQCLLVFAWYQDGGPRPVLKDDGNVLMYNAKVEFATAPAEESIFAVVKAREDFCNMVIYLSQLGEDPRDWSVRTMEEYAQNRRDVYNKAKLPRLPKSKHFLASGNYMEGYHARFYSPDAKKMEDALLDLLGVNRNVAHFASPYCLAEDIWDTQVEESLLESLLKNPQQWPSDNKGGRELVFKMGDEPLLPAPSSLAESAAGLGLFRIWLAERGRKPGDYGLSDFSEAAPIDRNAIDSREKALLYLDMVFFLQESSARLFAAYTRAIHRATAIIAPGSKPLTFTSAHWAELEITPDYIFEGRHGGADMQGHHYGSGDSFGPRQIHVDLLLSDLFRGVSERYGIRSGLLWFPSRINQGEGVMLSGLAALNAGLSHFHMYGYGPMSSGWEWFSDDRYKIDAFLAAARVLRLGAMFEDYWMVPGKKAEVATILSRSGSVWNRPGDNPFIEASGSDEAKSRLGETRLWKAKPLGCFGWLCELRMIHAALRWASLHSDIIGEEELDEGADILGQYRAIYLYSPNLSHSARRHLAKWVEDGGVLFLDAMAATRDEADTVSDWLPDLTAGKAKARLKKTQPGKGTYFEHDLSRMPSIGGFVDPKCPLAASYRVYGAREVVEFSKDVQWQTLAVFDDDGTPAVVVFPLGQGKIVKSAVCLGASLAATANPPFQGFNLPPKRVFIPVTRNDYFSGQGIPFRIRVDRIVHELLVAPARIAGVVPTVTVDQPMVEGRLFVVPDGSRALLTLVNHGPDKHAAVGVSFRPPRRFKKGKTIRGHPVDLEWQGETAVTCLPLDLYEIIKFTE
ncbi:MAG: hypothetical protein JW808_07985 [Victivallales bacterium]|nr:hypothetical protein [Victivallales bacterium]